MIIVVYILFAVLLTIVIVLSILTCISVSNEEEIDLESAASCISASNEEEINLETTEQKNKNKHQKKTTIYFPKHRKQWNGLSFLKSDNPFVFHYRVRVFRYANRRRLGICAKEAKKDFKKFCHVKIERLIMKDCAIIISIRATNRKFIYY